MSNVYYGKKHIYKVNKLTIFLGIIIAVIGPIVAWFIAGTLPCSFGRSGGAYCLIPLVFIPFIILFGIILVILSFRKIDKKIESQKSVAGKTNHSSISVILNSIRWFFIIIATLYSLGTFMSEIQLYLEHRSTPLELLEKLLFPCLLILIAIFLYLIGKHKKKSL